jgi:hypothetical protein
MKRPSNARLRRLLERVRKDIESGAEKYICHAITYAGEDYKAGEYLRNYIMRGMGECCYTLEGYLKGNNRAAYDAVWDSKDASVSFKGYRLQWIDWMLEEL